MCYFQKIQTFNFQFSEREKNGKKEQNKKCVISKKIQTFDYYFLCAKRVHYFNE